MIKFFRAMRIKLLTEHKIGKYLTYAVGEIILVVIGILIALYLNNLNELEANEDKIVAIFKEIQKDLQTDIERSKNYFDSYIELDSLQFKVLNNEYSFNDYEKDLIIIGRYYRDFIPRQNGYNKLKENLNLVPKKYDSLVKNIKSFYEVPFSNINTYNERIRKTVYDYLDVRWSKKWSLQLVRNERTPEMINYFLNNLEYRSYVLKYVNDRNNLIGMTQGLRYQGTDLYNRIEKIIGNSTFKELLPINQDVNKDSLIIAAQGKYELKEFVGKGWSKSFELNVQDDQITLTFPKEDPVYLQHHRRNIYVMNQTSRYLIISNNQVITRLLGRRAIYTKIKE